MKELGFKIDDSYNLTLSGKGLEIYEYINKELKTYFKEYFSEIIINNPLMKESDLEKFNYNKNFPQNIIHCYNNISNYQRICLRPASCFQIYINLENSKINNELESFFITGPCFRAEDNKFEKPFRLPSFTMSEIVFIGNNERIIELKNELEEQVIEFFTNKLYLPVKSISANDAFFEEQNKGAKILQKIKDLKREFVIDYNDKEISLGSINLVEEKFTSKFNIKLKNGQIASSMCLAFGIERIVACILIKKNEIL